MQQFQLQVNCGIIMLLPLKWVLPLPPATALRTPSQGHSENQFLINLTPLVSKGIRDELDPLNFSLVTSPESAQKESGGTRRLSFFPQCDFEGSAGVDILRQDISKTIKELNRRFYALVPRGLNKELKKKG